MKIRHKEYDMDEHPIGPPLPVEAVIFNDDGTEMHVRFTVPRDHPAYEALTAGLTGEFSVDPGAEPRPLPSVHGKIPEV